MSWSSSDQIGEIIQNAVVFNAHNWRNWQEGAMSADSLIAAVRDFFDLLEARQIRYVLVGGIALLYYVEGRNTQDLDLLMAVSQLEKLPELVISDQDAYFVRAGFGNLSIDVLLTRNLLFRKVLTHYSTSVQLLERNVPIATVEGLLLLKLYALPSLYGQGNFARVGIYENDIAMLVYYYRPHMEALFEELANHVDTADWAELKRIVAEIQSRADRFGRQQGGRERPPAP